MQIVTDMVGMSASWQAVAGQLLVSALAALSVCQDLGLRIRMGAIFWFLIAAAFGISALVTAIRSDFRFAPTICVVVLCFETWLILRRLIYGNSQ